MKKSLMYISKCNCTKLIFFDTSMMIELLTATTPDQYNEAVLKHIRFPVEALVESTFVIDALITKAYVDTILNPKPTCR